MSLRDALAKAVNISPVMDGKEQIRTDDVLGQELTIAAFDIVPGIDPRTKEEFTAPVFNFVEFPDKWYRGGASLTRLVSAATALTNGDIAEASVMTAEEGIRIKLDKRWKRDGTPWVSVKVL